MELFGHFSSTGFTYQHVCVPGKLHGYHIFIYLHYIAVILVHSTHKQGSNQQLDFLKLMFSVVAYCFILARFTDIRNKIPVHWIHPNSSVLSVLQFWLARRKPHTFLKQSFKALGILSFC